MVGSTEGSISLPRTTSALASLGWAPARCPQAAFSHAQPAFGVWQRGLLSVSPHLESWREDWMGVVFF